MDENQKTNDALETNTEPEIVTNDYGVTKDSTVVIEEETRTVLLTDNETIIIEKEPKIDLVPKNRPRNINAGMWGQMEITTVGLGMLAVLTTILLFVFLVLPAKKEPNAPELMRNYHQPPKNTAILPARKRALPNLSRALMILKPDFCATLCSIKLRFTSGLTA